VKDTLKTHIQNDFITHLKDMVKSHPYSIPQLPPPLIAARKQQHERYDEK
jgi:hypothetical protein